MIDPVDYARIEAASAPVFSVDGTALFYLRGAGLQQVWSMDLESGASRALSRHDETVSLLRRAPGDDRLIYAIDAGGDERHQLWLLEDGVARALTDDPAVIHGMGAWSPDGTRISLTANDRDPAHFDVLTMDLATGARTRLMQGRHEATVGAWAPDGRMVAVLDYSTTDQRPIVIVPGQAPAPMPRPGKARYASLRWDGEALLGLTDAGGLELVALCRIDPATGAAEPIHAPEGRDVEEWALSSGGLLATVENDRGVSVLRVGPRTAGRAAAEGVPAGVIAGLAWSPDGTMLAFSYSSACQPAGLWLWQDGAVRPLWQPDWDRPSCGFDLVQWTSFDGRIVPGWLAMPAGDRPTAGWPAVMWVHGGPASQARPCFRADMQSLLAQGYAVLMPNVRGSSGYGRAALESDDVERRLDSVHDLAAGRQWLAGQPEIDAARIAVMGQSYGGYMVLAAVTEYPSLWRCAIDFYGIADFATLLEATGPWRRAHRAAEYGDPLRHRALFDRISPIRHAGRIEAPLLVLHGRRDPRVGFGESEQVVEALGRLGRPPAFEAFDYAGHGFVRPDDKARVYSAVAAFLAERL